MINLLGNLRNKLGSEDVLSIYALEQARRSRGEAMKDLSNAVVQYRSQMQYAVRYAQLYWCG